MSTPVTVTREDGQWVAAFPTFACAHTWASDLETLAQYIEEVIILELDLPSGSHPPYDLTLEGLGATAAHAAVLRERRKALQTESQSVAKDTAALTRALRVEGYTTRDIGGMIGITHARVAQILRA